MFPQHKCARYLFLTPLKLCHLPWAEFSFMPTLGNFFSDISHPLNTAFHLPPIKTVKLLCLIGDRKQIKLIEIEYLLFPSPLAEIC